jgi:hypothetical protein
MQYKKNYNFGTTNIILLAYNYQVEYGFVKVDHRECMEVPFSGESQTTTFFGGYQMGNYWTHNESDDGTGDERYLEIKYQPLHGQHQ